MALDHYVSQVHLKRFNSPALGGALMHAIRNDDLKKFTPSSKDVCRIQEGNTNHYLTEPRIIEAFLKTIEFKYNRSVAAFEAGKPDEESIYAIAGFAAYVQTCSPTAMRLHAVPLEGTVESLAKHMDKENMFPPPPPELGGKTLTELLKSGAVRMEVDRKYSQATGIANIFYRVSAFGNFAWQVLINEQEDCPFFTSDFPIAMERANDPRIVNRVIPLTPRTAIRIMPDLRVESSKIDFNFRNFSFRMDSVTHQEAIEINRILVRSAESCVFFRDDQKWVAKFVEANKDFRVETKIYDFKSGHKTLQLSRLEIAHYQRNLEAQPLG